MLVVKCPACQGSGLIFGIENDDCCPRCDGDGMVVKRPPEEPKDWLASQVYVPEALDEPWHQNPRVRSLILLALLVGALAIRLGVES